MFNDKSQVSVTVVTCMGKTHYFTVPYYSAHYGEEGDKLILVNAIDWQAPSEQRMNTIEPNTVIPTLIESERCCSIIVESTNCDQTLRLTFSGKLSTNADHSINYDNIEHHITLTK